MMIIITNDLNNIETKMTTPQVEGIEFISMTISESEKQTTYTLNASYNDILSILNNGKLPIIKLIKEHEKEYWFINYINIEEDGNNNQEYICASDEMSITTFSATTATGNMTYIQGKVVPV